METEGDSQWVLVLLEWTRQAVRQESTGQAIDLVCGPGVDLVEV